MGNNMGKLSLLDAPAERQSAAPGKMGSLSLLDGDTEEEEQYEPFDPRTMSAADTLGTDHPGFTPPTDEQYSRKTLSALDSAQEGLLRRDRRREVMGDVTSEFEGATGAASDRLMDEYADGVEGLDIVPDQTFGEEVADDLTSAARIFTEFVAGPELALMGIKWDEEGFEFGSEVFMDQVMNHPYETAFTVATYAFPVAFAARRGANLAMRAAKLATDAGEDVAIAAGKGFLERKGLNIPGADRFGIDKVGWQLDDHAKMAQTLARPDVNMMDTVTGNGRYFDQNIVDALKQADSPEMIEQIIPKRRLQQMITTERANDRYLELAALARKGELTTPGLKMAWAAHKNFSNRYAKQVQEINSDQITNISDYLKQAEVEKYYNEIPSFSEDNAGVAGEAIYEYMLEGLTTDAIEKLATIPGISSKTLQWAQGLGHKWQRLTKAQFDEGYLTKDQYELFREGGGMVESGMHLPAIKKGTEGFADIGRKRLTQKPGPGADGQIAMQDITLQDSMKIFGGPTTKQRGVLTTRELTREAIPELVTAPKDLFVGGYVNDVQIMGLHRTFRDVIVNHAMSGGKSYDEFITTAENFANLPKSGQDLWLSLDGLDEIVPGLSARMRRMIDARVAKDGLDPGLFNKDPVISRELIGQFFRGDGSARTNPNTFTKLLQLSTAIYKSSKTALNPATHMGNMAGNMHFLSQVGVNIFGTNFLNDGHIAAKMFSKLAKQIKKSDGMSTDEMMNPENLAKILGDDRFITNHLGHKIDLAEHYSDPIVKNMFEAQAFETVEGFASAEAMLKAIKTAEAESWGDQSVQVLARIMGGHHEIPGVKQTMHKMSSMYLAEDMIPKVQYYAKLIRDGWSKQAAVREVGRRLPQYATVGVLPKASRRLILPWITWTAESARIFKNNMQDFPIQAMMHLQAPQIIQGVISATGSGPESREEQRGTFNQAASHATRFGSVAVDPDRAPEILGALGTAALGAAGGMRVAGAKGAMIGMAGGAMAGYLGGEEFGQDDDAAFNRILTNDWLTQASLFPSNLSQERYDQLTFKTATNGGEYLRNLLDMAPVAPFAVVMPLIDIALGRDTFGNEVRSEGPQEMLGKSVLQMMNHHAPPMFTKFMGNVSGDQLNPISAAESYAANGGQPSVPKHMTPGIHGLSEEGADWNETIDDQQNRLLTGLGVGAASGAGVYKGLTSAGVPKKAAGIAAVAQGAIVAAGGTQINVSKFMSSMGYARDSKTEQPGDWTLDAFANSIAGISKSFPASGQQQIANEKYKTQAAGKQRGVILKKIKDNLRAGRGQIANSYIKPLYDSFVRQHGNARVAKRMFNEAYGRVIQEVAQSQGADGMSLDTIKMHIRSLEAAQAEGHKFADKTVRELRMMLQEKRFKGAGKIKLSTTPSVRSR